MKSYREGKYAESDVKITSRRAVGMGQESTRMGVYSMKGRRLSSSATRKILSEGLHQYLDESVSDSEFKKWQARNAFSLQDVHPNWQYWIYRVYLKILEQGNQLLWESFIWVIERRGLHFAIVSFLDHHDYYKPRDYWHAPPLPDIPWPVHRISLLQEILATHTDPWCRELAAKWLPYETAVPSEAVEVLGYLVKDPQDEVRWWSAVHLAHLSPDALVSAEPLVETLSRGHRCGWSRRYYAVSCTLAGEAALALAQLGNRAWDALRDFDANGDHWSWLDWERPWPRDPSYVFIATRIASLIIQEDPDRLQKAPPDLPAYYYWTCWGDMGWAALRFLQLAELYPTPHLREIRAKTLPRLASPRWELGSTGDWVPHLTLQTRLPRRLGSGRLGYLSEALAELGVCE